MTINNNPSTSVGNVLEHKEESTPYTEKMTESQGQKNLKIIMGCIAIVWCRWKYHMFMQWMYHSFFHSSKKTITHICFSVPQVNLDLIAAGTKILLRQLLNVCTLYCLSLTLWIICIEMRYIANSVRQTLPMICEFALKYFITHNVDRVHAHGRSYEARRRPLSVRIVWCAWDDGMLQSELHAKFVFDWLGQHGNRQRI